MPHPARIHDYWLGGGHNFAADRELADQVLAMMPGAEDAARVNQAFLRRAALFMVASGIRQFLDIGSGIPTVGTVHEIVQRAAPQCRVVYVDFDPVAVAHSELMLRDTAGTAVLQADLRDVASILDSQRAGDLLDFSEPIGLLAPMLHFVPDSWEPAEILAGYRDRLAAGSLFALAQLTADAATPGLADAVEAYRTSTQYRIQPRTYAEMLRLCAGFDLVEPGVVGFADWRPEGPGDRSALPGVNSLLYAAVGHKP